jgi:Tol biopolymer transport system component
MSKTAVCALLTLVAGLMGCAPQTSAPADGASTAAAPTPESSVIGTAADRIAFGRWGRTEDRGQPPALWTANADGSDPQAVGGQRGWYIEWSPDRSHLIFDLTVGGSEHIATIRPDGSGYAQLTTGGGFHGDPAYSPDGTTVAFAYSPTTSLEPASAELWVMDADGSNPRALLDPADSGSDWEPVFSPDGSQIVFTREQKAPGGLVSAVHVVNADGTDVRRLTPFDDYVEHPRWSPDGATVIYNIEHRTNLDDPRNGVWTVPAEGGAPVSLLPTDDEFHFFKPAYSPDGSQILVGCAHRDGLNEDLCVANADGSGVQTLIETPHYENHGVWF